MASKINDVVEDVRCHMNKFSNMQNPGQDKKGTISFSKELLIEDIHKCLKDGETDYLRYLNEEYMSVLDDPKTELSIDAGALVVYDGLVSPISQTDDNAISKKLKRADTIHSETSSNSVSYPFPLL